MFNDFYGIYKGARDGSWRFLIDYKINALPIDFNIIAKAMDIKIRQDTQGILLPTERGATITDGTRTYILLKPSNIQTMRYTTAHEFGHIFLGHTMKNGRYGRTFADSPEEYQAERFAIDILAPACVLWGLNLHTPEDIARVCNISMTSATKRARRMEELYRRNMFLSHPLERQVYRQFQSFIIENRL